jgi:PAS domain S-box-containing protein
MDQTTLDNILCEDLLDQLSDSMIILDADDRIVFFNRQASKYLHLAITQKFSLGMPFLEAVSRDRQDVVKSILSQVRRSGKPLISEVEYKDTSGRAFSFEVSYNPIVIADTSRELICIVSHEITHQKTFERKSVQLIQELSTLIENASAMIFSIDSREYVTEWNRECTRLTGNEKNEVFTKKIYNYLDDRCHMIFTHLVQKVLTGEPVSNIELIIKTLSGSSINLLANATPKFNSAGNVIGILFVGQDITELSQYRRSLEEKVKDRTEKLQQALEKEKELVEIKNRFVSVASHEFRIPLSSIGGYVKSIKSNPNLRDIDLRSLDAVEAQLSHMRKLLDDILTIKKGEVNPLSARLQSLEIIQFLRQLIDEVLTNANNSHQVITNFEDLHIEITSDEKLLRNIFLNLISNAIKFSPSRQEIFVLAIRNNDFVEIEVRDQGIGISEDDQKKIFEPFHRGANASNIKGTGLGLYIARKAVDTLGGEMKIQTAVNAGTTIIVKFPLSK